MNVTLGEVKMVAIYVKSALEHGWSKDDLRNMEKMLPKIKYNVETNFWSEAFLKEEVWQSMLEYIFDNLNRITEHSLF